MITHEASRRIEEKISGAATPSPNTTHRGPTEMSIMKNRVFTIFSPLTSPGIEDEQIHQ